MEPDTGHARVEVIVYVKAKDGSPPDHEFERILTYTFEGDSTEHETRFHRGDTSSSTTERINDKWRDQLWIDGGEYNNDDSLMDCASETGSSPMKAEWCANLAKALTRRLEHEGIRGSSSSEKAKTM
jgi:hypothetical protein